MFVGRISYPLYLWHFPLLVFARARYGTLSTGAALGVVALSFVLAFLTYRLLELPLRSYVRRVSWRPVPVLIVLMLALGGGGLVVDKSGGAPSRLPLLMRKLTGYTYAYKPVYREGTCFLRNDQDATAFTSSCVEPGPKPLLFLWGDSHAADLYPGLRALEDGSPFPHRPVHRRAAVPRSSHYSPPHRPFCEALNQAVVARLRALHPQEVLLSAAWERYNDRTPLIRTVALLRRLHVPSIVLVGPGPDWPQGLPQVLYTIFQERNALPTRITRGLSDRPPALDVKMRALARRLHIPYVAPLAALCNAHGCITRTGVGGNEITVWDTAHFTRAGSTLLARATERTLLSGIRR